MKIKYQLWAFILAMLCVAITPNIYSLVHGSSFFEIYHFPMGTDTLVYESYLAQVKSGAYLFHDHFTSEPQRIGIVNIFWLSIGILGRITGAAPEVTFTLSRLIFFALLIVATYKTAGLLWQNEKTRLQATVFTTTIAGLGYLFMIFSSGKIITLDLFKLFSVISNHAFGSAHISAATILTTVCLLAFHKWSEEKKLSQIVIASISGAALLQFQPYIVPVLVFIPMFWLFLTREKHSKTDILPFLFYLAALSLPVIYHICTVVLDPFTALRYAANITPSAPFVYNLLAFSVILFLCGIGAAHKKDAGSLPSFLALWIFTSFAAAHLPFRMNDRFFQGTAIALGLLSYCGFEYLTNHYFPKLNSAFKQKAAFIALAFCLWSGPCFTIPLLTKTSVLQLSPALTSLQAALESLPQGIILNDGRTTLFASHKTNHWMYAGHWSDTIDFDEKMKISDWLYFEENSPQKILSELQKLNIDYVLYDKSTDRMKTSALVTLYENDSYAIFGVPKP
ncbi:MAG: hypothetical protein WCJ29_04150 [bacterium]